MAMVKSYTAESYEMVVGLSLRCAVLPEEPLLAMVVPGLSLALGERLDEALPEVVQDLLHLGLQVDQAKLHDETRQEVILNVLHHRLPLALAKLLAVILQEMVLNAFPRQLPPVLVELPDETLRINQVPVLTLVLKELPDEILLKSIIPKLPLVAQPDDNGFGDSPCDALYRESSSKYKETFPSKA